ncbi:MAG: adenylate kinase [Bacteroidetes bacterium RIFCSPLOWO2_12_FULL_35_15]|nr:MAG: adenylate kinase [Bacteroidetes bacterium RIFCSPLOWO2_12_FULL_35_15]
MLNIILFGPPGAGKGTQSEKLILKYKLVHLSTGDIFRANIKGETALGKLARNFMDNGQLVPDEVTISMLEQEVNKNPNAKGFIFDGFPRTKAQAEALDKLLKSINTSITMMLALEVKEEELKKRLLLRGKESGRPDDQNPLIIQKRIDVYNNETAPVKNHYSAQKKYIGVKGIGAIEEIFNALCDAIDRKLGLKKPEKKKGAVKKVAPKKVTVKKAPVKKSTKKAIKKVAKKTAKKVVKKTVKKTAAKKGTKKVIKKVVKKVSVKKATKKNVGKHAKKIVKKVLPKIIKKSTKKVVAKKKKK